MEHPLRPFVDRVVLYPTVQLVDDPPFGRDVAQYPVRRDRLPLLSKTLVLIEPCSQERDEKIHGLHHPISAADALAAALKPVRSGHRNPHLENAV